MLEKSLSIYFLHFKACDICALLSTAFTCDWFALNCVLVGEGWWPQAGVRVSLTAAWGVNGAGSAIFSSTPSP